jgi:hypothetical protein
MIFVSDSMSCVVQYMILLVNSRGVLPRSHSRSQALCLGMQFAVGCCLVVTGGGKASIAAFLAPDKEQDMRGQTVSQFANSIIYSPIHTKQEIPLIGR